MIKVGVADYGMNVYYGGFYDYEQRMDDIRAIGFDGVERLRPINNDNAVNMMIALAERGMSFSTVEAATVEQSIKLTAAFGRKYIWADKSPYVNTFDGYVRTNGYLEKACAKYGIRPAVHNHLGQMVETQEQLDEFMARCPGTGLLFDTGHFTVAGGDLLRTLDRYYDRVVAVHLKNWQYKDPANIRDGYFCGLGQGNLTVENEAFVKELLRRGYDGWIFIEHDTHLREPLEDLKESREILRSWGV